MASTMIMGMTGVVSRSVLYGLNTVEVTGLKRFQDVLDSRQDVGKRQRGLLTGGLNLSLRVLFHEFFLSFVKVHTLTSV